MPESSSLVVVGLGELLWDVFPGEKRPGGAPANVAFQAEQLGCRGVVASRVGIDADGEELLAFLTGKGLTPEHVQRDPVHPTGRVTVSLDAGGHPSYVIHENVAWDFIDFSPGDNLLAKLMLQADAVCFGTLAQRCATSQKSITAAIQSTRPGCLRVYDINLRQSFYGYDVVHRSLELASVVKLNDEEVATVADLLDVPAEEKGFAQAVVERFDVQLLCITRGAKGCLLVTRDGSHEEPGVTVQVADTVGAGDAFTAGLITATLHDRPLPIRAQFANRVGALVASRHGAMPDLKEEFAVLRKELGVR